MLAYETRGNTKKQLWQSLNLTYLSDQGFNSFHFFWKTLPANWIFKRSIEILNVKNHSDPIINPIDIHSANRIKILLNQVNRNLIDPSGKFTDQMDSSTSILMFNTLHLKG